MNTPMLPCSIAPLFVLFDFTAYTEQGPAPCLGNSAPHSELDLPTSNYLNTDSTGQLILDHPSWRLSLLFAEASRLCQADRANHHRYYLTFCKPGQIIGLSATSSPSHVNIQSIIELYSFNLQNDSPFSFVKYCIL